MNHHQMNRKTFPSLAKDCAARAPLAQTQVSGDSNGRHRNRSKSKNKIPKSVRYDLENALVSLCDVWFEEIKPYLVHNNIKVHAARGEAGVAGETGEGGEGGAAGDNCSHLDPASSASRCELCRLLSNAGNSIRSAVAQAAGVAVPAAGTRHNTLKIASAYGLRSSRKCGDSSEAKQRKRRRRTRASGSQHVPPQHPPPRARRTYAVAPRLAKGTQCPESRDQRNASPASMNKCVVTRVKTTKKKDKSTQTGLFREHESNQSNLKGTMNEINQIKQKVEPCHRTFGRRNATTSLPAQKRRVYNEAPPLFQNDLIDIIVEKNEKRLQLLYKSVGFANGDYASTMNLAPPSAVVQKALTEKKEKKPWR